MRRKSIRRILFARAAGQRDKLSDIKIKEILPCRRESRTVESFLSSKKSIDRFVTKHGVSKACFFVVVYHRLLICDH